jgi:hypothetical protein
MFQASLLDTPWEYTIEWYPGGGASAQGAAVVLTAEPVQDEDIVVSVWTSSDSPSVIVTPEQPLVIYASVRRGTRPVLGAKVSLEVQVTGSNGALKVNEMLLLDNGNGGEQL